MHERPYEKLIVWKEAHTLCLWVYEVSEKFPDSEKFRLTNQMCKSASSVPMNIAEGNSRRTKKGKSYFLDIAIGSLEELHYQYRLAKDLRYLTSEDFSKADTQIHRVSYLLTRLRASL